MGDYSWENLCGCNKGEGCDGCGLHGGAVSVFYAHREAIKSYLTFWKTSWGEKAKYTCAPPQNNYSIKFAECQPGCKICSIGGNFKNSVEVYDCFPESWDCKEWTDLSEEGCNKCADTTPVP